MSEPIRQRLARMNDRYNRHRYDIGDYWNMCDELGEHIDGMESRLAELEQELRQFREAAVTLRKTRRWLRQVSQEEDRDEDATERARHDLEEAEDLLEKMADPKWTTGYVERLRAKNQRFAELEAVVKKLPVTKDGVRVVPDIDKVYHVNYKGVLLVSERLEKQEDGWVSWFGLFRIPTIETLSTPEAAAAKAKEEG